MSTVTLSPVELVGRVCDASLPLEERLRFAGRVRGWLDATTLALTNELGKLRRPDGDVADAARLSGRSTDRELRRARTIDRVPELGQALEDGLVSVDHVDVLDRALGRVDGDARDVLLARAPTLVEGACGQRPEDFARDVKAAVDGLLSESDREARLVRQRRAARFRSWVDEGSGMWRCVGDFDPDTGRKLQTRIDRQVRALFAAGAGDGDGPNDPLERQQWLAAQAVGALFAGRGGGGGQPEVTVVLRPDGVGGHRVDWGLPVELPRRVFEELFTDPGTPVVPVIVSDGVVLHAPGVLDLGYTTRLANRAQRRALRAVHETCSVPGCHVRFDRCEVHHIIWWRHGGPTDLWNLTPLCWRHHTAVHDGTLVVPPPPYPPGWKPP